MFERIKRLYMSKELTKDGVANAVKRKLITPEQYLLICGEPYDET